MSIPRNKIINFTIINHSTKEICPESHNWASLFKITIEGNIAILNSHYGCAKINFCPWCGKKLLNKK